MSILALRIMRSDSYCDIIDRSSHMGAFENGMTDIVLEMWMYIARGMC